MKMELLSLDSLWDCVGDGSRSIALITSLVGISNTRSFIKSVAPWCKAEDIRRIKRRA